MGAVAVNPVAQHSAARRATAPENPVANETESQVPTPPAEAQTATQSAHPEPEPDAIPLKGRNARKQAMEARSSAPNKFREQQQDAAQPGLQRSGPGGELADVRHAGRRRRGGGRRFAVWDAVRLVCETARATRWAQNWRTGDLRSASHNVGGGDYSLILRDGSVSRRRVSSQSSGNAALDFSAQRAVLDAAPFPPLPPQYPQEAMRNV